VSRTPSGGPRLLFVVNDASFFLSHRLALAEGARVCGYDVHIATPPGHDVGRLAALDIPHHPIPLSRRGMRPWEETASLAALHALYRRLRPDLVHHVTVKPVLYGSIAARLAGVPAVVNAVPGLGYLFIAEGPAARARRRAVVTAYRLAFRGRTHVIFQNEDDRKVFVAARVIPHERTAVIRGSGVDLAAFAPSPEPVGPIMIVLPARMLWDKGVGEFVVAARTLGAAGADLRCVLVGDVDPGNPSSIPQARLRDWQAEGVIEWWGHRSDMPAVLAAAHIVCLPSYREGLPKSLLEAAASARPIVATDVTGCRDIVRDGENGFLVPARDAATLAQRLHRLAVEPDLRRRMGRRGREIAEAEFGVQRVVTATLELYRSLVGFVSAPAR
jgi:glycosyltransferase involved in cell wall biosynthesis